MVYLILASIKNNINQILDPCTLRMLASRGKITRLSAVIVPAVWDMPGILDVFSNFSFSCLVLMSLLLSTSSSGAMADLSTSSMFFFSPSFTFKVRFNYYI